MPDINVVVFGRGNGESILVELEQDNWMVVDSFINVKTKKPAAISYLESIGLDPSLVLKRIVITHFHEDHIKGMSSIIESASPDAKVYMPDALTTNEALNYYSSLEIINGFDIKSMTSEIQKVFKLMKKSERLIIRLNQDKVIFKNENHIISALSPSDYDSIKSTEMFTKKIIKSVDNKRTLAQSASKDFPNHFCIAINIENLNSKKSILLGADLEITLDKRGGWDSAINTHLAPKKRSIDLFKVPHHGSKTAFHKETWECYTSSNFIALITTFGSSSLPREESIKIYKTYTETVLCATKPKYSTKKVLSPKASKIVNKKTPDVKVLDVMPLESFGFIHSTHSSQQVKYQLYGDALKL